MASTAAKPQLSVRQQQGKRTRNKLVGSAIELFSQQGISETTVGQIAAHAAVGKGTVYHHFEAKEDMVVAFMADLEGRLREKLRRFAQIEADLETVLVWYTRQRLRLMQPYRNFVRAVLARTFAAHPGDQNWVTQANRAATETIEELLILLGERGMVRLGAEHADMVLQFRVLMSGITAQWAADGTSAVQVERIVQQQMRMLARDWAV
jgi:AcrR family transcriptional regulator